MKRRLTSLTGRGLVWATAGEIVLAVVCVLYLGLSPQPRIAFVGALAAGLLGLVSIHRMWRGRHEFGPEHERLARRGAYLFLTAGLLYLLAFLSLETFTAPTTGFDPFAENTTSSPTETHRFKDLQPSLVMASVALVLEVSSGAVLLWELVGTGWRRYVAGYGVVGAAAGIALLVFGLRTIAELQAEAGPRAGSANEARLYFDRYLREVLGLLMTLFLGTRLYALVLLQRAQHKVADAERQFEAAQTSGPAASP